MTNPVIDSTISDTAVTVQNLRRNQNYFWRVRAKNLSGWGPFSEVWQFTILSTDVESENSLPTKFALYQNYPNPFNPVTKISYSIPKSENNAAVELEVYNLRGKLIRILVNRTQAADNYQVEWNGRDDAGIKVPSGVYLYRLRVNSLVSSKKMLLLK